MKNIINETPEKETPEVVTDNTPETKTETPVLKKPDNTLMIIAIIGLLLIGTLMISNYLNRKNETDENSN